MVGCKHCPSKKAGQSTYKCEKGHRHCGPACLKGAGCIRSEEAKEAMKKNNDKAVLGRTAASKKEASKQKSAKLLADKKAINDELVAKGVEIEAVLPPAGVLVIAKRLVMEIKKMVPLDHAVYVYTSGGWRVDQESFACVTGRGGGERLMMKPGGYNEMTAEEMKKFHLTAVEMKKAYRWVCVASLYESTSAVNMNEVEKKVHQLLYADRRSIWIRNGAGGVHLAKDEKVLTFSLSIIHGPRTGLDFAAEHPREL